MQFRRQKNTDNAQKLTRLQRFGLFFFDHFKTTLILWAALACFGILSYTTLLKREGFPAVEPSLALVNGTYFVNDSQRVDREVAQPLTDLIRKQSGIKSVDTSTGDNFFVLQVEFNEGTDAAAAAGRLESAAKAAKTLPASASAEFKPLAFSIDPEGEGDNLLIAFFGKETNDTAALNAKTQEAVTFLQNDGELKESVERVRAVALYRTGNGQRRHRTKSL